VLVAALPGDFILIYQIMSSFISLCEDFVVDFLLLWCELRDVVFFDTSCCNTTFRNSITNALKCKLFVLKDLNFFLENVNKLQWIVFRKIKLCRVWLNAFTNEVETLVPQMDTSQITEVQILPQDQTDVFKRNPKHCFALINRCVKLSKLTMRGISSNTPQFINSEILTQLKELTLYDTTCDGKSIDFITQSCPNLTHFSLVFAYDKPITITENDVHLIILRCKQLISFGTNYPVKQEILDHITRNIPQIRKVFFEGNKYFSLECVDRFISKTGSKLEFISFTVNDTIGRLSFNKPATSECCIASDMRVERASHDDKVTVNQFILLFPVTSCQAISINTHL
jgi:hypothetical protein